MHPQTLAGGRPPDTPRAAADDQFVTFTCNGAHYGVPIMAVREIRSWQPTAPLPQRRPGARGVLDIRGTVVEVFDLSALLGGPALAPTTGNVVLVLSLGDRSVGLLVEAVSDIIQASPADLLPVPAAPDDRSSIRVMASGGDRLTGILDLDVIFPAATS